MESSLDCNAPASWLGHSAIGQAIHDDVETAMATEHWSDADRDCNRTHDVETAMATERWSDDGFGCDGGCTL